MYYPDWRYISSITAITREALLPEAATGEVRVSEGQQVDVRDQVAQGIMPSRHVVIDAANILRLRDPEALSRMMLVKLRQQVRARDPIAGANPNRGRRVFAPMDGLIVYVGEGRIIMQENPEIVRVEAGVRGQVRRVYPGRGVAVRAAGALVQGVWGSGGSVITALYMEPPEGLEGMTADALDTTFKNTIMVTTRPLSAVGIEIAEVRGLAGVVAPSMPASLIGAATSLGRPILLTEGFGNIRMSSGVVSLLNEFDGYQATLDAYPPHPWQPRRPELVINRLIDEELHEPDPQAPLRRGMRVRVTREPYLGQVGRVVEIMRDLQRLDNGLRLRCARVEMITGEMVLVPLVNLEFAGR